MQVQRSISTLSMLFAALGGIIGSGWLLGPYYVAKLAGPFGIFSWIIGGLLMMVVALTFAELSTMFPVTGSVVRFPQFSHGQLTSFTMSWIGWLSCVIVAPLEVMALLQYASNYVPWLIVKVGHVHILTWPGIGLAAILMLFMSILNVTGVRTVIRANTFIVWFKLLIPIVTMVVLFTYIFHSNNLNFATHTSTDTIKNILQALPSAGVIFSFIGFTPAIALAGESRNPQRALPIAIIGSLLVCILLYTFLQITFVGAISPADIAKGWSNLNFSGDAGPFAGIAEALGITWLVMMIYIGAAISPFGTALTYTTATARVNYAMSQNGYMPAIMQDLNKRGVPTKAIIMNFFISMLLFLPFPGWQDMVSFLVSAVIISYAVGPLSLVVLRKLLPEQKRPFRLPIAGIFCLIAFYVCNLIVYWTGWDTIWRVLIAVSIGYLFLAFYRFRGKQNDIPLQLSSLVWLIPYFTGLGIISYLGAFGGKNILTFGIDFIVIGLFSTVIFLLATRFHNSRQELDAILIKHLPSRSILP